MALLAGHTVAFVGGGAMAEAMLRGLLRGKLAAPEQLVVSDPLPERRGYLAAELGVRTVATNDQAVAGAGIIVLAVKPQALDAALAQMAGRVHREALVLSIVAGARMAAIRQALGVDALVRIMPNTPGQIGEGISVWTATPETTSEQRAMAGAIVGALGQEVYVEDEDSIDKATAISGSGPAYVLLFIEALTDAGVHIGFPRPVAEKLALQTVRGTAAYAQARGLHLAVLRNMVTSPGGTTAEALYELENGALRAIVDRAVRAAYRRAKSLGDPQHQ
ncbi:MAG: pyrroline-5-carboxylate reductase [Chloroflexi bacterium]|nr:pyrroline-5-carboxylate reductase [Chloroflexota bacterium]